MSERLTQWLLGILAMAFFAWAGVVWRGTATVADAMSRIDTKLEVLVNEVNNIKERQGNHEGKPHHAKAGNDIAELKATIRSLERNR